MPRELLILRHAKSAWDTDAPTDFERPLARRGLKAAPRMGKWIRRQKMIPDHIIASPARRAQQTVKLACKAMKVSKKEINQDARIYGASTEDFLTILAETPKSAQRVMLVGHNPGLEFLFAYLCELPDNGPFDYEAGLIKTATAVLLEMPDDWSTLPSGCARLVVKQNPRQLK
ncbi:MAG: histidine phosphatase family protein [Magnetococcales bacterium]|nr:histidine phosphatase family protein [Magnetococcales bacterium]